MATRTLMTAAEFSLLETSDSENYELAEGELISSPSATPRHNRVRYRLESKVQNFLEANHLGEAFDEIDCRISEHTVRKPDLAIFLGPRQVDQTKVPVPFSPDIAVEVISPSDSVVESNRKIRDYLGAGSQEVWILYHENRELSIHTKTGIRLLVEDQAIESPLLPGFAVTLADLLR
jgi:Uma2 family endonuclease